MSSVNSSEAGGKKMNWAIMGIEEFKDWGIANMMLFG